MCVLFICKIRLVAIPIEYRVNRFGTSRVIWNTLILSSSGLINHVRGLPNRATAGKHLVMYSKMLIKLTYKRSPK